MTDDTQSSAFADATWAILELMGHRRRVGMVRKEAIFGAEMCRIDVLGADGGFHTEYYGGSSIYALTPVSEEIARMEAKDSDQAPISYYTGQELKKAGHDAAMKSLPKPVDGEPIQPAPARRLSNVDESDDDHPF